MAMESGRISLGRVQHRDSSVAGGVAGSSDRDLLERFNRGREGDEVAERAFAALVRRHGPMVLGVCRQLLGDPHEAEDAFQVTFVVLARRAGSIRRPELLGHWLYGVAVRTSRKARALADRRRRHEAREGIMAHAGPVDDPGRLEARLSRREQAELLHEELGRLPEQYRVPVVLCYLEGLTNAEAAERLRWPSGTLSVRLMRARALLRSRLTRRGLAPSVALLATAALAETASAVPADLAEATARVALRHAGGVGSTAGAIPESVSGLSGHVLADLARARLAATSAALAGGLAVILLSWLALAVRPGGDASGRRPTGPGSPALTHITALDGARAVDREAPADPIGPGSGTGDAPREVARRGDGGVAGASPPPAVALTTYRVLVGRSGRDADAQVRLALWCEANGLGSERLKHLALAILNEPDHATARGLLGQVAFRGRWRPPEGLDELLREDTRFSSDLAEYRARRDRMEDTADAHWRLARWCEKRGLEHEARAHFTAVTRREPAREAAWRRLGYKEHRGRWMRPDQIAAETSAVEAQRKRDRYWRPLLARWRGALRDDSRRAWAEAGLAGVTDPAAAPAIWATFAAGGPDDQALAIRLLGQVDGPAASRALAMLSVSADPAEVRRVATETLARRDPRDVVGLLIGWLIPSIKYEVRPVRGPGEPGVLFVEGEPFNVRRLYTVPSLPDNTIRRINDPTAPPDWLVAQFGDDGARLFTSGRERQVVFDNIRGVSANLARAARATLSARQQLAADIRLIEAVNRDIGEANRRIEAPLLAITGRALGADGVAWRSWWADRQGYAVASTRPRPRPRPTVDREIPLPYDPGYRTIVPLMHSCFGAGTPVRTREGLRPIESIRVGDVVLAQESETGSLCLTPVLAVFHNKPAPTLRVDLDDESVVATGIHRFWKVGRGWVMARDLEPGDEVRTLDGPARVSAVSDDSVRPVFNLEVGEGRSFFVGTSGALVHDNSTVQPVPRPFDEAPDLAAADAPRSPGDAGPAGRPVDPSGVGAFRVLAP